jgi:hypothetical protein
MFQEGLREEYTIEGFFSSVGGSAASDHGQSRDGSLHDALRLEK